jgi:hypothetical protein
VILFSDILTPLPGNINKVSFCCRLVLCYLLFLHVAAVPQLQARWRDPVQRHLHSTHTPQLHAAETFCCFVLPCRCVAKLLQPFRSFKPDGVILFSDILTPLPGIGVPFEIDDNKGPLLDNPIRSKEQVRCYHL